MDGDGLDGDGNHFGRHKPPIDTIKVDGNVFMAPWKTPGFVTTKMAGNCLCGSSKPHEFFSSKTTGNFGMSA